MGQNSGPGDEPSNGSERNRQRGLRGVRGVGLFLLLFAVWLAWSGLYQPLVIGLGVASCLLCVWIIHRMHDVGAEPLHPVSVVRGLGYLPWLLKEIAVSNWQVVRIVLSPGLPIQPVVLTLAGSQRTDLGRVIYGNSITLTPGTLTIDVYGPQLTVHALTREGAAQLESGEMDARVTRLERAP
jgi:multicomponent Na+:H+ antiporter subunit E